MRNVSGKKLIHYRMLVIDVDDIRARRIEEAIKKGGPIGEASLFAILQCDQLILAFAHEENQLSDLPDAAALNVIWIHMEFPHAREWANRFYAQNPLCYIIIYGGEEDAISPFLHSRPIGYSRDISSEQVNQELLYIKSLEPKHEEVLRLRSRDAYYDIWTNSILYCQSQGRQTLIYVDSFYREKESAKKDRFVAKTRESSSLLAYEQNRKLDEIEQALNSPSFVRIHQSYLINRRFVTGLTTRRDGWFLLLNGQCGKSIEIPISEKYRKTARALFEDDRQ